MRLVQSALLVLHAVLAYINNYLLYMTLYLGRLSKNRNKTVKLS